MICEECKTELREGNGFYVCHCCGLEHDRVIDNSISYKNKQFNESYHDTNLSDREDFRWIPVDNTKYYRLQRINMIANQNLDPAKHRIYPLLFNVCKILNIPDTIRLESEFLWNLIRKKEVVINYVTLAMTCLYKCCCKHQSHVSVQDIVKTFYEKGHRVTIRLLLRDCSAYSKYFEHIHETKTPDKFIESMLTKIKEFNQENRIDKKVGITSDRYYEKIEEYAKYLLKHIKVAQSINQYKFTAGVIYSADRLFALVNNCCSVLTQQNTSKILGVAQYTIREYYCNILRPIIDKIARNMLEVVEP